MTVRPAPDDGFPFRVETLVIGAGACGLTAALAAREAGDEVLVLEADAVPTGSTALSAGLIPAAGTRFQAEAGIEDDPERFADDVQAKAHGEADPDLLRALCEGSALSVEWLAERFGLPFSLVADFDYPGHTRRRMHGLPTRSGAELMDALRSAAEGADIDIVCDCRATTLFTTRDGRVAGIEALRPDGSAERIGCERLVLACNGFGGAKGHVARHMPDIAEALYFGHDGNRGEAVDWAEGLGAATRHLGAYQGHGNVAHPHGILITWAVIMEGGFQVNADGRRFWNEAQGYSEAARAVLAQPGGTAVAVFDERIAGVARQFKDFRDAEAQGAVRGADDVDALAAAFDLPADALRRDLRRRRGRATRRARPARARFLRRAAARTALPRGARHGGALPHAGRARRGARRTGEAGGGRRDRQPLRRRRRGLRRVGVGRCGLSIRQRAAERRRAGADRGGGSGVEGLTGPRRADGAFARP